MHAGQKVLLLFGSGNRDEREFDAPERFDVTRQFEGHLSFGFGIHYCIGVHLGRLEGRVGIDTLLTRLGDYELASDTVHWRQAIPTRPMAAAPHHVRASSRADPSARPTGRRDAAERRTVSHPRRTIRGGWRSNASPRPTGLRRPMRCVMPSRAAKGDDPLTPVTVIVPTNYVGVAVRRQLAGGSLGPGRRAAGTASRASRSSPCTAWPSCSARPGSPATGRRPVSTPVLAAAVRGVLAREPGRFAAVAAAPGDRGGAGRVVPRALALRRRRARCAGAHGRACLRPRAHLPRRRARRSATAWYDEADLMDAAVAEIARDTPGLADLGAIVVLPPARHRAGRRAHARRRVGAHVGHRRRRGVRRRARRRRGARRARAARARPSTTPDPAPTRSRARASCRCRTPTTKSAPSSAWSSTRCATAWRSIAWRSCSAPTSRTRGSSTSSSRRRASRTTAPRSARWPRACSGARCSRCSRSPIATSTVTTSWRCSRRHRCAPTGGSCPRRDGSGSAARSGSCAAARGGTSSSNVTHAGSSASSPRSSRYPTVSPAPGLVRARARRDTRGCQAFMPHARSATSRARRDRGRHVA